MIVVAGDNAASGNLGSVLAIGDAGNFAALYAALNQNILKLVNAGGTYDTVRAALGTTGILAIDSESTKATYSVGTSGFTPAATATDFFMIIGSASKTVRVRRIAVAGIATAASNIAINLIKRSTANSGGTAASLTIPPHDANSAAASAVVSTYSVNPTTGTSIGNVRSGNLNLGAAGAAGSLVWEFSNMNDQAVVLRGVAQALVLNWGGAAVPGGTSMSMYVEWTEE
jgi:hypothetical protein